MYLLIDSPATIIFQVVRPFSNNLIIKDNLKRVYHFRPLPDGVDIIKINFPLTGKYFFNTDFDILKRGKLQINQKIKSLPDPERQRDNKITAITTKPNMDYTPARIFTNTGKIELSEKYGKMPLQMRYFIILHEYGHFFYKTEWKCDLFALYHFINSGYNYSQALYSLTKILKCNNTNRDRVNRLKQMIPQFTGQ